MVGKSVCRVLLPEQDVAGKDVTGGVVEWLERPWKVARVLPYGLGGIYRWQISAADKRNIAKHWDGMFPPCKQMLGAL